MQLAPTKSTNKKRCNKMNIDSQSLTCRRWYERPYYIYNLFHKKYSIYLYNIKLELTRVHCRKIPIFKNK